MASRRTYQGVGRVGFTARRLSSKRGWSAQVQVTESRRSAIEREDESVQRERIARRVWVSTYLIHSMSILGLVATLWWLGLAD